jgi:hypothetical protein
VSNLDAFLAAAERVRPKPVGGYAVEEPTYFLKEETWKAIIQALKEANAEFKKWSIYKNKAASMSAKAWLAKWEKEFSSEGGS